MVVSNVLQRSKKQKKEMKEQLNKLKKEALAQYDVNLAKNTQGETPIYFSTLIHNLMQNAKLIIEDINAIFVYQIRDFELVKFGLTINSFQISKSKGSNCTGTIQKDINVTNASIFFEFYDSLHLNDKFRESLFESDVSPDNPAKIMQDKDEKLWGKNYIVNNFDFLAELKADYLNGLALEVAINTGPILIYLRQRQLRHLTRAIQAIIYFRSDRPEIKPGISNGTVLWWKYACIFL